MFPFKKTLTVGQILDWADAHFKRTRKWPTLQSGRVADARQDTWGAINQSLKCGYRGLPGGSSLVQLLAEARGKRNRNALPPFTVEEILDWADEHRERIGKWPNQKSGPIAGTGENWMGVQHALRDGGRGMPGGSSVSMLLRKWRKATREKVARPLLSLNAILTWADAHHGRTGNWPTSTSGPIPEVPGETWQAVNDALHEGKRGIKDKTSLTELLYTRRGVQLHKRHPPLTLDQIRAWAEAYRKRTGRPTSLTELLTGRPKRLLPRRPPLTEEQILGWVDAYFKRHGRWPTRDSGVIPGTRGETWLRISMDLTRGNRGLKPGSSLYRLLKQHRSVT